MASKSENENLINLSMDEDQHDVATKGDFKLPTNQPLIEALPEARLSLDNNPFDFIQKLSICRQDDPFDVVEKEASLKALKSFSNTYNDNVKVGNLLSLSGEDDWDSPQALFSNSSVTTYESAEGYDLENESPPIVLTKCTPDTSADSGGVGGGGTGTGDSSDSSTKQSGSLRNRKKRPCRNRLLKISLSNSTYSTPMSSKRSVDDNFSQNEEDMLAAESPLKSMYDDDMSNGTASETAYTEKDFDADLEMMQIPMLNKVKTCMDTADYESLFNNPKKQDKHEPLNPSQRETSNVGELPDLETLRRKLSAKRAEANNNCHDIKNIIKYLKTRIIESDIVDEQKKDKVNGLLESLSSTLTTTAPAYAPSEKQTVPQPIKRQGTFCCEKEEENLEQQNAAAVVCDVNDQPPMEEIPDVMMRSSATYDGESTEDKEYLNLPQIDVCSPPDEQSIHPYLNDVVDQLQHILEQHQLGSSKQSDGSNSSQVHNLSSVGSNPTFIVVMPTLSHEESKDLNESQIPSNMRRRSQSLSIHDKLKIVKLPLKPSPEPNITDSDTYESPPFSATNTSVMDSDGFEFKTPARFQPRRNSFSSATPRTPIRYSLFNPPTLNKENYNGLDSVTQPGRRLSSMGTLQQTNVRLGKPDFKKKVVKTPATSIMNSNGPLKATLPLKKIAPNIKSTTRSSMNTSINLLAKSGHMSNTSTPMSETRLNGLNVIGKTVPSACSTPAVRDQSPGKLSSHIARYSNLSTTPIRKPLAVPTAASSGFRRRTFSDSKPKSPVKTRLSVAGSSVNYNAPKPYSTRSSTLRPSVNSKTSMNTRASVNGTSAYLANRNKGNKLP